MTPEQALQYFPFSGAKVTKRLGQLRLVCKPAPPDTRARGGFPGRIRQNISTFNGYDTSSATPFNNFGYTVGSPTSQTDVTQAGPIGEVFSPRSGLSYLQGDVAGVVARLVPPIVAPQYSRPVQAIAPETIPAINQLLDSPNCFYGGTLYSSYFNVGEMRRSVGSATPTGHYHYAATAGNIIVAQMLLSSDAAALGFDNLGVTPITGINVPAYAPAWMIELYNDPFGGVHFVFPVTGVPIRQTGINGTPYESAFVGGSQFRPGDPFSGSPDLFIPVNGTAYCYGSPASQNGGIGGSIFIGQGTSDSLYGSSFRLQTGFYVGTGGGGDMYETLTRNLSGNGRLGISRCLLTSMNGGWNSWAGSYAPIDQTIFAQVLLGGRKLVADIDPYGIFSDNPGTFDYIGTTAYGFLVTNTASKAAGVVYLILTGGEGYIEFSFEDEAGNPLTPAPATGDNSTNVCTAIAPDGTVYLNTATQGPYLSYDFRIKFPNRQLPRLPPRTLNNVLTKHSIIGKY